MDEMADLLVLFSNLGSLAGRNAGVIGVGGGTSVEAADLCEASGLSVRALPVDIQEKLREFTPVAGTSVRNPLDTNTFSAQELSRTIELVANCPEIDFLVIQQQLGISFLQVEGKAMFEAALDAMIDTTKRVSKPTVIILRHRGSRDELSQMAEVQEKCVKAGIAVIPYMQRAALALSRFISFRERRKVSP